tara:strand:- start:1310 stop:1912 length:603 start_codon:yes stop_codon:yes gene_type:complete
LDLKITKAEIFEENPDIPVRNFPKYTKSTINYVSHTFRATRPEVVGKLAGKDGLFEKCPYPEYEKWREWYLDQYPNAIDDSVQKILDGLEKVKDVMPQIDEKMVRSWVQELVIDNTFIGLSWQKAILKKIAKLKDTKYRLATPEQESKGIDGFLGDVPVSIKPSTYRTKNLQEDIKVKIIFYEKVKDGIIVSEEDISQFD